MELSNYEKIEEKKKAIAEKIGNKTPLLKKATRQYKPRKQEAECRIARDVFNAAMDIYELGEYTWEELITELSKSLKAIKAS